MGEEGADGEGGRGCRAHLPGGSILSLNVMTGQAKQLSRRFSPQIFAAEACTWLPNHGVAQSTEFKRQGFDAWGEKGEGGDSLGGRGGGGGEDGCRAYLPGSSIFSLDVLTGQAKQLLDLEHIASSRKGTGCQGHLTKLRDLLIQGLGHL